MGVWVDGGKSIGAWLMPRLPFAYNKVRVIFYGYLVYVFHKIIEFSRGILSFSRASSECLYITPCTLVVMVLFPSHNFNI